MLSINAEGREGIRLCRLSPHPILLLEEDSKVLILNYLTIEINRAQVKN